MHGGHGHRRHQNVQKARRGKRRLVAKTADYSRIPVKSMRSGTLRYLLFEATYPHIRQWITIMVFSSYDNMTTTTVKGIRIEEEEG